MSAQEIETARQNLQAALRPAVGAVPAQIMFAVEDLIRAYLVNHVEHAAHLQYDARILEP